MACTVPDQFKNLKWHVIKSHHARGFELAEWVNDEKNGPDEKGHWVRWGYCGDFPSLCQANYIVPFPDQQMLEGLDQEMKKLDQ